MHQKRDAQPVQAEAAPSAQADAPVSSAAGDMARQLGHSMDYAGASAALQPGAGLLAPVQMTPAGSSVQMDPERAPQLNLFGPLPNSTLNQGRRRGARRPRRPRVSTAARAAQYARIYTQNYEASQVDAALAPLRSSVLEGLKSALGARHVASWNRSRSARRARAFRAKMKAAAKVRAEQDATQAVTALGIAGDAAQNQEDAKARIDAADTKAAATTAIEALAADGASEAANSVRAELAQSGKQAFCARAERGLAEPYTIQGRAKLAEHRITVAAKTKEASVQNAANAWKDEVLDGGKETEGAAKIAEAVDGIGADAATATNAAVALITDELLENATKDAVASLEAQVAAYLAPKLGKGGAGYFRSDEVRGFRAQMKRAARQTAYAAVDAEVDGGDTLDAQGSATKRYVKVNAKKHAYAKAKASVDTATQSIAEDGAKTALTNAGTGAALSALARKGALAHLRANENSPEGLEAAAKSAANRGAKSCYAAAQKQAYAWKNTLLEKSAEKRAGLKDGNMGALRTDAAADAQAGAATTLDAAKTRAENQVTQDDVGKKSVKASLDANTAAQGMGMIGRLCDMSAPSRGDACKLEVELKIPVPGGPTFVLLRVVGEAQRGVTNRKNGGADGAPDSSSLNFQCEFALGGGISLGGLELNGAVGFFVRGQGMDTHKCMNAITYAGYRGACALNDGIGNWWAGARGRKKDVEAREASGGIAAMTEAELWAAMLEEQVFMKPNPNRAPGQPAFIIDEDAFADLGASLTGKGKVKASGGEGEATLRGEAFKRYDGAQIRRSLEEGIQNNAAYRPSRGIDVGNAGRSGTSAEADADARARRRLIHGRAETQGIFETKVKATIGGKTVEFAGQLTAGTAGWEIAVSSMLVFDTAGNPHDFERIAAGIVGASVSIGKTLGSLYTNHKKDGKTQGYNAAGDLLDIGNDTEGIVNAGMGNALGKSLADTYKVNAGASDQEIGADPASAATTKSGASAEFGLKVALTFGSGGISLSLSQVKVRKLAIDIGQAGLDVNVERSKRLAKLGYEDGHFVGEALGFGNSVGS